MASYQVNKIWRLVMTALCFALFGFGSLLLSLLWFPCLNIFIRQRHQRSIVARRSISYCFHFFMRTMRLLGVLDYRIEGKELLTQDKNCLIVANHPSLIDYVMLASVMPTTDCIVKQALQNNFFVKGIIHAADYLINNQSDILLAACKQRFKNDETLIIFPEGTRTIYGEAMKFQRGAANIAIRCQIDIRLVHIFCNERMLDKQSSWYHVPPKKPTFTIKVGHRIDIKQFIAKVDSEEPSLVARRLNRYLLDKLSSSTQSHKG